jgi:hypothetical protein
MSLRDMQAEFRAALFDRATLAPPPGLNFADPVQAARRFSIYRNNVFGSLTEVLRAGFPVCALLVGAAFWRQMAADFITAHTPKRAHLLAWGGALAEFLETYPGLDNARYLPDMARLEWARVQAYHAADDVALDLAALQTLAPEALPELRLSLRASATIVASEWPVLSLWQVHDIATGTATALPPGLGAEAVLVFRPDADLVQLPLSPGEHTLLCRLTAGETFAESALAAIEVDGDMELQAALVRLLLAGVFCAWEL